MNDAGTTSFCSRRSPASCCWSRCRAWRWDVAFSADDAEPAPPLFAVDPATGRIVRPSAHAAGTLDDSFTRLVNDAGLPVSPLQIVLLATVCAAIAGGVALLWLDNVASGLIAALTVFTLIVPLLKIERRGGSCNFARNCRRCSTSSPAPAVRAKASIRRSPSSRAGGGSLGFAIPDL